MTPPETVGFSAGDAFRMDPSNLPAAYRSLLQELSRTTEFVVIGAVAIALHGGRRVTRDVDAIVRDCGHAMRALYASGFRMVSRAVTSEPDAYLLFGSAEDALAALRAQQPCAFKAIHVETGVEFDTWLQSPGETRLPIERIFANAVQMHLAGLTLPCASVRDLIELKRIALEDNPGRAAKDEHDIAFLESLLAADVQPVRRPAQGR